jgi:hypothetical protein
MQFNLYKLQQSIKKTKETVSDKRDGAIRKKLRNLFYRIYPAQSLFNRNVSDSLVEILSYIQENTEKNPEANNSAAVQHQKAIFDSHEIQIEELRTQIIKLQQESEELRKEINQLKGQKS